MIDANINRVSEGIRVLEDIARFILENKDAVENLRRLRHYVRKSFAHPDLLLTRDSIHDIGYEISSKSILDKRTSLEETIKANFKRIQEGLRSIEEGLKIAGYYEESKQYENMRYQSYALEKLFIPKPLFVGTDIYGITGENSSLGRDNVAVANEMIQAGIRVIQYREKNKSKYEKHKECQKIREITKKSGTIFIVNDDVDIAITVKADGVHVGQDDLPLKEVKKIAQGMIVGCSTHNEEQAKEAVKSGPDYIGVGPVFTTKTKQDVEKSEGLLYLKWVSENISIPYVAIGGINEKNITKAKKHGGKCFAMISEIAEAADIKEKVNNIRKILSQSSSDTDK
jgi:thiamine-phosphate pyrophosphorylase